MIKRNMSFILKKELKRKEISVLVGSRQVGKTTLLKELFNQTKGSQYIAFDDFKILDRFENNIDLFIEQYIRPNKVLFIDEFQYAKDGGKKLKYIYDSENIKLFISGSSKPELTIQSLQYLVGRAKIIELYPLSFQEFLVYKNKTKSILLDKQRKTSNLVDLENEFQEFLLYGGYPKIVLEKDKKEELKQLMNLYLHKEIRDILAYKTSHEFEQILNIIALQDAKILNQSNISLETGISRNKVNEIINVLNKTYIVHIIRPFLGNKKKELIKSPKIIFQDSGIKNMLLNNFNELKIRSDKGELYENFIANELIKGGKEIKFWNFENKFEMDFVLFENERLLGIELKSRLSDAKPTKSIKKFIAENSPDKIIVFNENIEREYDLGETRIIYTHYLNISSLLSKQMI